MTTPAPPDPGDTPETEAVPDLSSISPQLLQQIKRMVQAEYAKDLRTQLGVVHRTINWRALTPEDLEADLLKLNAWVNWLCHEYGLPPQTIPPMWHRHPKLLWELSALRQHWLTCYDQQAKGNMGVVWHNDFASPANAYATGVHLRHPPRSRPHRRLPRLHRRTSRRPPSGPRARRRHDRCHGERR